MKTIPVKTKINKLINQLGSIEAVAFKLDITTRYVTMLMKGEKKASSALAKVIDMVLR